MIRVAVLERRGDFTLDAEFSSAGRVVALVGASGAGKTTMVNVIAGLIRPLRGQVEIDGVTLLDTEAGICLPPHRRGIGYVFQDGRLFPHLSVRGNLEYGWREDAALATPTEVIGLLGLERLLTRAPRTLSGGEAQRVAIGRALLAGTRLLLMDEPLSSLDGARKAELLPYIERLRDHVRVPIIYVSHAMDEVERLADQIVRLEAGRLAVQRA
nr:molybdenum ABC transporter ATP-binding protein [Govania unica]